PDRTFDTLLMNIISWTHMPLFFFISGYFSYKVSASGEPFGSPQLWSRFKQLVIPMVIVSALFALYQGHSHLTAASDVGSDWCVNISRLWCDESKCGYWFTICLFEIMVIYYLAAPLLRRLGSGVAQILTIPAIFLVLIALYKCAPTMLGNILELKMVAMYTPVFMIGVIARKNREAFNRIIRNQLIITSATLLGVCLLSLLVYRDAISFMSKPGATLFIAPLWHLLLVVVAFNVTPRWVGEMPTNVSPSIKIWAYLGRNSLGIYLLQYFFLFPMPCLAGALESSAAQFVPTFALSFLSAALITAVCCGVISIIRTSRHLAFLTLGDSLSK
nr:acyltransferase family protein [Muribaculaceae bacterium]